MSNDLKRLPSPLTRPKLVCKDPSRTKQEYLAESLTLNILRKYNATGVLPSSAVTKRIPVGDNYERDLTDRTNLLTSVVNDEGLSYEDRLAILNGRDPSIIEPSQGGNTRIVSNNKNLGNNSDGDNPDGNNGGEGNEN